MPLRAPQQIPAAMRKSGAAKKHQAAEAAVMMVRRMTHAAARAEESTEHPQVHAVQDVIRVLETERALQVLHQVRVIPVRPPAQYAAGLRLLPKSRGCCPRLNHFSAEVSSDYSFRFKPSLQRKAAV